MIHQKILSKKPLVQARWFTVNELEVEIKPGDVRKHHNVERKPTVFVFPLDKDGEIYLTNQYRYNLGKEILEGVAGYLEEGEEPLAGAKRELKEETGLIANAWKQIALVDLGGGVLKSQAYLFVAKDLEQRQTQLDDSEDIQTVKMPLSQAIAKVMSGEIATALSMTGLLMVDKMMNEGKL